MPTSVLIDTDYLENIPFMGDYNALITAHTKPVGLCATLQIYSQKSGQDAVPYTTDAVIERQRGSNDSGFVRVRLPSAPEVGSLRSKDGSD
jgi:hypothetical protein